MLSIFLFILFPGLQQKCPPNQRTFQKILGRRPPLSSSSNNKNPLIWNFDKNAVAINLKCHELCRDDPNCYGYILDFNQTQCYAYTSEFSQRNNIKYEYLLDQLVLVADSNVAFFVKSCLNGECVNYYTLIVVLYPLITN